MKKLVEAMRPLRDRISENSAFLGLCGALAVFAFSLFLPWATVPTGMAASDGGSSSGWSELAFLSLLPFAGLILGIASKRRPIKPETLLVCIAASFVLLGFNNVLNRTNWELPYHVAHGNLGSELGAGFWFGMLALVAVSTFGLAWSFHKEQAAASA